MTEEFDVSSFGKWNITDIKSSDKLLSICCPCENSAHFSSHDNQIYTENQLYNYWGVFNSCHQRKTRSEVTLSVEVVDKPDTDNLGDDTTTSGEQSQCADSMEVEESAEEKIDEQTNEEELVEVLIENLKYNKMVEVIELINKIIGKSYFEKILSKITQQEKNDNIRLNLCMALLEYDVKYQIIYRTIFRPWCDENEAHLSVFNSCLIATMDKCAAESIEHIIIPLIFYKQSPFVVDQHALKDIMISANRNDMLTLLRKFVDTLEDQSLPDRLIPIFHIMVENSKNIDESLLTDIVALCSRSVRYYTNNCEFINVLLILIPRCSNCTDALDGIKLLANDLKGFGKIKISNMLK